MDTSLLRRIADNTDPKQGFSFIVSGNNSQILTRFNPPLQLQENKSYEMALVNLGTYYSIPISLPAIILSATGQTRARVG